MKLRSIIVVFLITITSCQNIGANESALKSSKLLDDIILKDLMSEYRKNSYLHWGTNEDGLSIEDATLRSEASRYPSKKKLKDAVEEEFNGFFGNETKMEYFVQFMEAHGAKKCVSLSQDYNLRQSEEIDGSYSCTVNLLIPFPHSYKNFDPDIDARESVKSFFVDGHVPSRAEFLKWQEDFRFTEQWVFHAFSKDLNPTRISIIKFEHYLITF